MVRPRLYLSAVSTELLSARELVAKTVHGLGFDTVSQDDFRTGYGGLRRWLQGQIDGCEGLIQIVGDSYGPEPPTRDPDFGRVSYAQLEFLYASRRGKMTWVIMAGELVDRDRALEQLDLPRNPAHADAEGYQAERRKLQRAYIRRLKSEGHLHQRADSGTELEHVVLGLVDELGELERRWERRRRRRRGSYIAGAGLVALALAVGGGWWAYEGGGPEVIVANGPLVDAGMLSEQLRHTVEATYRRELGQAKQSANAVQRQRLEEAARTARAARLSRIPALADSLVQIEFGGAGSKVFVQMIQILAERGVDAALAYVSSQLEGILTTVHGRPASEWASNRTDLQPLLKAAALYEAKGQPAEARKLYEDVLSVDPDWPEARHGLLWLLIDEGDAASVRDDLEAASRAYREAHRLARRLVASEPSNAKWQRDLSVSHTMVGDVAVAQGKLEDAATAYQDALATARQLVARDPADARSQRDMFYLCFQISHLEAKQERWDAAISDAESCRTIAERLLGIDPANPTWKQDVEAITAWQQRLSEVAASAGN